MLRIGLTHYNTAEEVERVLEELRRIGEVGVRAQHSSLERIS